MSDSVRRLQDANTLEANSVRIVQVNWFKFMAHTWTRMTILNKFVLLASNLLTISQIAIGIAVIINSSNEECDRVFRIYISIYVARIAISCPFNVIENFERAGKQLGFRSRRAQELRREEHLRLERQRRRQERQQQDVQSVSRVPVPSNASIASVTSTIIQPKSNWFVSFGKKIEVLIGLATVLLFLIGHFILATFKSCSQESPKLYYTMLAFIALGYFVAFLPLALYASSKLCLPCVNRVTNDLNITDLEALSKSNRKEEIGKIPVFRYGSLTGEPQEPITPPKKTSDEHESEIIFKITQSYKKYKRGDVEDTADFEETTITPKEDALCCICLSDYEQNDIVCKLWCKHHYHRSCIADWLQGDNKCPLCQQDFRGKSYKREDELGESSRPENSFQMGPMNSNR